MKPSNAAKITSRTAMLLLALLAVSACSAEAVEGELDDQAEPGEDDSALISQNASPSAPAGSMHVLSVVSQSGQSLNLMFPGPIPSAWLRTVSSEKITDGRLATIAGLAQSDGLIASAGGADGIVDTAPKCTTALGGNIVQANADAGGHIGQRHVRNWPGGIIGSNVDQSLVNRANGVTRPQANPASAWYAAPDATSAIKQVYAGNCTAITNFLNRSTGTENPKAFTYPTKVLGRSCSTTLASCTNVKRAQLYIRPTGRVSVPGGTVGTGRVETAFPLK